MGQFEASAVGDVRGLPSVVHLVIRSGLILSDHQDVNGAPRERRGRDDRQTDREATGADGAVAEGSTQQAFEALAPRVRALSHSDRIRTNAVHDR